MGRRKRWNWIGPVDFEAWPGGDGGEWVFSRPEGREEKKIDENVEIVRGTCR